MEPGVKTLYVVDGHSQLFRAYHAVGYLSTSKGIPTQAVLILSTMLWKLCREEQPDYLAVAWDPPGPTFRDALSAEYKATRAAMPDDLVRQLPYVKRLFEALRIPVIEVAGFEADDVLATLVARALERPDLEVVIVTGDKDLLQLVGPRVRVLSVSGRTGEPVLYDEAKVRERWGVEPGQIADVLALMGDAIDNIKGVHGVGEKTAVKLIGQFGSVERLYENLPLVPGKLRETLATGRKDAFLSRELATLNRDVPLAFDLETARRREPDWTKLRALWMELEFTRLLTGRRTRASRGSPSFIPPSGRRGSARPTPSRSAPARSGCTMRSRSSRRGSARGRRSRRSRTARSPRTSSTRHARRTASRSCASKRSASARPRFRRRRRWVPGQAPPLGTTLARSPPRHPPETTRSWGGCSRSARGGSIATGSTWRRSSGTRSSGRSTRRSSARSCRCSRAWSATASASIPRGSRRSRRSSSGASTT
ncbi:MAG: hypothetical protein AUG87_03080 [Candidatus Rokubacteria bacterium 13_1_20CM_4_70_14]|nr:MAG: hypothetical protein AUG87_03080 [Candidatus Rokubacteria bacterium 13_1_20CM_4_70_14]